jgi:PKD repeat protein
LTGTAPLAVSFDGRGSSDPDGSISSYAWAFGDGGSASGATANHTYAAGTYTATLTVTDNLGATASSSLTITVTSPANRPPSAMVSATPLSGTAPLAVSFDGRGSSDPDGSIAGYAWAFGDGASASGSTASHTYGNAGTYTATLTVTDNLGATGSSSVTVTVSPATVVINAPSNLTASNASRTVTLHWTDNSNNEAGFYIERALSGGTFTRVGQVAANKAKFSQSVAKGTYIYRVQAFGSGGATSPYSNQVTIKVK